MPHYENEYSYLLSQLLAQEDDGFSLVDSSQDNVNNKFSFDPLNFVSFNEWDVVWNAADEKEGACEEKTLDDVQQTDAGRCGQQSADGNAVVQERPITNQYEPQALDVRTIDFNATETKHYQETNGSHTQNSSYCAPSPPPPSESIPVGSFNEWDFVWNTAVEKEGSCEEMTLDDVQQTDAGRCGQQSADGNAVVQERPITDQYEPQALDVRTIDFNATETKHYQETNGSHTQNSSHCAPSPPPPSESIPVASFNEWDFVWNTADEKEGSCEEMTLDDVQQTDAGRCGQQLLDGNAVVQERPVADQYEPQALSTRPIDFNPTETNHYQGNNGSHTQNSSYCAPSPPFPSGSIPVASFNEWDAVWNAADEKEGSCEETTPPPSGSPVASLTCGPPVLFTSSMVTSVPTGPSIIWAEEWPSQPLADATYQMPDPLLPTRIETPYSRSSSRTVSPPLPRTKSKSKPKAKQQIDDFKEALAALNIPEEDYSCICGSYLRENDLKDHLAEVHRLPSRQRLRCPWPDCHETYRDISSLKRHCLTKPGHLGKRTPCPACLGTFSRLDRARAHYHNYCPVRRSRQEIPA
ncbi:hypothetical protein L218DRAFT_240725 [Marasmius fiardii PR-910]|nr:hypothetical protein L218DRAFT_240725 [Marasmius fiardii PR-910]